MATPKPSLSWFSLVQARYGCHPDNVVFLGDDDIDAKAAEQAGVDFYGTQWGTFTQEVIRVDFKNFLETAHKVTGDKRYTLQQERDLYFCGYYLSRSERSIDRQVRSQLLGYKDNNESAITTWERIIPSMVAGLPPVDMIVRALGHAELEAQPSGRDRLWSNLAEQLHCRYVPTALRKNRVTRKSTGLNSQERHHESLNSYEIALPSQIRDAGSILVVDDVYTTGSTIHEIKRAITAVNPAAKIYAFTLLRTCRSWDEDKPNIVTINTQLNGAFNRQPVEKPEITGIPTAEQSESDWISSRSRPLAGNHMANVQIAGQKRLTASYTGYASNFVLHNLPLHSEVNINPRFISCAKILKNLLLRGAPTHPSRYLASALGSWRNLPGNTYLSANTETQKLWQKSENEHDIRQQAISFLVESGLSQLSAYCKTLQSLPTNSSNVQRLATRV